MNKYDLPIYLSSIKLFQTNRQKCSHTNSGDDNDCQVRLLSAWPVVLNLGDRERDSLGCQCAGSKLA